MFQSRCWRTKWAAVFCSCLFPPGPPPPATPLSVASLNFLSFGNFPGGTGLNQCWYLQAQTTISIVFHGCLTPDYRKVDKLDERMKLPKTILCCLGGITFGDLKVRVVITSNHPALQMKKPRLEVNTWGRWKHRPWTRHRHPSSGQRPAASSCMLTHLLSKLSCSTECTKPLNCEPGVHF